MKGFRRPVFVGCTRCGDLLPRAETVYAMCNACGARTGLCRPCSLDMGANFLRDAMAWHREQHHKDISIPVAICKQLLAPDHPWRTWGETAPVARGAMF